MTTSEVAALFNGIAPSDGLVGEYLLLQDFALDTAGVHIGLIAGATWVEVVSFRGPVHS